MRTSMNWSVCRPPSPQVERHMKVVWEDKHGHTYLYDPITDIFWHKHDPSEGGKGPVKWWQSREGLGR